MADLYRPGEFYRICDRCGRKRYASQTRAEWTGLIVCHEHWEARHPQDFVRGRSDNQSVPDPRPRPADVFISAVDPITTEDLDPIDSSSDGTLTA